MVPRFRHVGSLAAVTMASVLLSTCGQSTPPSRQSSSLSGSLTVFAAASLSEALTDDRARLRAANPGLDLAFSFAGSQQLVAQLQAGAPADVVATADQANMDRLVAANLVEAPRVIARNVLEIAVAPGNPRRVSGLADLSRPDLKVVLADPSVPAGKYARQSLDRQSVVVHPVSLELDVKSALQKVASGDADAAIVYATDVKSAGSKTAGVAIPPDQNVVATYPVAVVSATKNQPLARAFIEQLVAGAGAVALRARGFLAP